MNPWENAAHERGGRDARGGPLDRRVDPASSRCPSPRAPSRDLAPPRPAPDRRDDDPHHHVRDRDRRDHGPRRAGRRRCPCLLGGRPDLAERRRPVPPDRAVPALRLRPVDAAAVRAVGAAALGRRLVRVARRHDRPPALDDPLGLSPAAARDRDPRCAAGLPDRGKPRHRQHQPPADADALGRPVHGAGTRRTAVVGRDLDEVGPGRCSCRCWRRAAASGAS